MKEKAVEYFRQGFSCSESIIKAAIDEDLCDSSLLPVATSFSGGMSSGCLCGAIAGAQLVIGYNYGKNNKFGNEVLAKNKAKEFLNNFKEVNNATCCRILTAGLDHNSPERRNKCEKYVASSGEILDIMLKGKVAV